MVNKESTVDIHQMQMESFFDLAVHGVDLGFEVLLGNVALQLVSWGQKVVFNREGLSCKVDVLWLFETTQFLRFTDLLDFV